MGEDANVVHESDVETREVEHGETGFEGKRLGAAAGGERLGCSRYELPPGKCSWPFHYHHGNEEALYVLSGEGTLRTDDGTTEIRAGTYVAFPEGEAGAHRVINDSNEALHYLCFSTVDRPDVLQYPDSEKVRVMTEKGEQSFPEDAEVGYWD